MKKETVAVITKYLLDVMFFAGIAVTLTLPWLVKLVTAYFHFEDFEGRYVEIVSIYFVLGILAVLILGELRKIFRTVLGNVMFCAGKRGEPSAHGYIQLYHCGGLFAARIFIYDGCDARAGARFCHRGAVQQGARVCV